MQHPQLHAGRSLKRTNKRMQKKNKKKLAHVLMGTSQPDFFFFFCYKWYTSKHTGRTIQWLKQIKKKKQKQKQSQFRRVSYVLEHNQGITSQIFETKSLETFPCVGEALSILHLG